MHITGSGIVENMFDYNVLLRIGTAIGCGFILGLERELTNKYAGLRTHILVCLGACIFTVISVYGFPTVLTNDEANGLRDTGRVAAQVVSGIGFIGAGAVLRNGPMIFGLTTAATLWIAAAIGMACGAGLFYIGAATAVCSVAVLTLIRIFERRILPTGTRIFKRYELTMYCNSNDEAAIRVFLEKNFDINSLSVKNSAANSDQIKIKANIEVKKKSKINSLYDELRNICKLDSISILEIND